MKTRHSGSTRKAIQVVLAAGVAVGATQAVAATDMFLKITGLPGESVDSKHKDEIDVYSFSQSMDGKQCPLISLSKRIDKSSPGLAEAIYRQKSLPSALLTVRKAGEKGDEYYKVTMTSVFVLSADHSFNGDSAVEEVVISARTTSMSYRPQLANGTFGAEIVRTIQDCGTGANGSR
jgi:type VI secretion system secreted protein Hcp